MLPKEVFEGLPKLRNWLANSVCHDLSCIGPQACDRPNIRDGVLATSDTTKTQPGGLSPSIARFLPLETLDTASLESSNPFPA